MLIEDVKIYWCKLIGDPIAGYGGEGLEWSVELGLDNATIDGEDAVKALKGFGLSSRIKTDDTNQNKGKFIRLKKNAVKKDGTRAKSIPVVDGETKPWDDRKVGNGSVGAVQVLLDTYGEGKTQKTTLKLMGMQVSELVPYEGGTSFKKTGETKQIEASQEW